MKSTSSRTPMVRRRSDNSLDKTGLSSQEDPLQVSTGPRRVNKGDEDRKSMNEDTTLTCYTADDSICYNSGDCVYIDSQRPDVAYFVCAIKEFRLSKRDSTQVTVRWYYRPSEVPDSVYQLLVQDRTAENGSKDNILEDESVKERELFISDATDVYPVSALRGKCYVHPFAEVSDHIKEYISRPDSFFYVLGYNPETRRLANTKGEIRVGPSHQAVLPDCCPETTSLESPREQLTWSPRLDEFELMMFLRAARSMAQYAGMCNGGTPEDGFSAISQDATTSNALDVLHENDYDAAKALQALVKKPYPKELMTKWTEDDMKKFVKGLRQHGKNFYKIRKELLPHKETMELVEYYYIWKKSQSALTSRPHRRRRHNVSRRKVYPRTNKNTASEFVDLSSCSEDEYDSDDSEKDLSLYCCRHCFNMSSRSWHHGGQNKVILCTECRIFYKKYGRLPAIEDGVKPPTFMFKVEVERELRDEDGYSLSGKLGLRSRRNNGMVQSTLRSGRNKTASPTEALMSRDSPVSSRRLAKTNKPPSPSSGSTSSSGSSMLGKEKHKKGKSKKGLVMKRSRDQSPDGQSAGKRKRNQESDEDANGDSSDASSTTGGRDSVQPDNGDASSVCSNSSNNEDANSNRSSSPVVTRSEGPATNSLPAKMKRVLIEEGRSCARTDAVFIGVERPKAKSPCAASSSDSAVVKESPEKTEAKDTTTDRQTRPGSRHGPSDTPASVTSHYESAIRNMLSSSGEYYMYPPNIPVVGSSTALPFGGFVGHPSAVDYGMMPVHMLPGASAVTGAADMRENAAKFAEGFEQWYAPYRSQNSGHPLAAMSYIHKRDVEQRNHEALVKGGLITDPLTGMCGYLPQHHHSHQHTHFHIHPHDQHLRALQAQNLSAYEAYQQHPGLWRNYPLLWQQHPELMHSHGNSSQQRSLLAAEDHAPGHIHGLGSTPLDRQLQQQLLLSQQSKHRQYMQEEYLRQWRHQHELEMKQRMEEAQISDSYVSGMFRKEPRSLQSPSQLENVVKKSMDSSGAYSSPQKKPPVTIDLSDE